MTEQETHRKVGMFGTGDPFSQTQDGRGLSAGTEGVEMLADYSDTAETSYDGITLRIVDSPETFLEQNSDVEADLVDVAQAAFNKPGIPTANDTRNHILPVSTLIIAYDEDDDRPVGFSAVDTVADTVYEEGIGITDPYQQNGLGKAMFSLGIAEELDGEQMVAYRTQNPAMYKCSRDVVGVHPRPGNEIPDDIYHALEAVAEHLGGDIDKNCVMHGAYPEAMYSSIPDGPTRDFLAKELGMDYQNGDAVLVGGRTTPDEINQQVEQYVGQHSGINRVERVDT